MEMFPSKAQTLLFLAKKIKTGNVLPVFIFTVQEYIKNKEKLINQVRKKFPGMQLVVRSSSHSEDALKQSNAGHFCSILNINSNNIFRIKEAIETVISSYRNNNKKSNKDEVFIQPFLNDIACAGVAFTADIDTLAPYYIINYDLSGSSDSVTSGKKSHLKTYVQYKNTNIQCGDNFLQNLISTLKDLEKIFNYPYLDVEFAVDKKGQLFIFQVRPIISKNKEKFNDINLNEVLLKIHKKIKKISAPHPNLLGKQAVYGVMPDWNPAEIIGLRPKPLAYSLYKELVTDSIWAYQRDNYGYRNLRSHPLMIMLMGVPYIDVRVDFNSFIPKTLNEKTAQKLVQYYLDKLIKNPALHDKVEFEIVHSCYHFSLDTKLKELINNGFTHSQVNDIKESLLELTNKVIHSDFGLFEKDKQQIKILKKKHQEIINSHLSLIDKIYWLIEHCKRYGTLPFAGIARSAFIATQFLKSLIEKKIISESDYNNFVNSFNTIARQLNNDILLLKKNKIKKTDFLNKYGHLRPGTYDILFPRYDDNFEFYFSELPNKPGTHEKTFRLSRIQIEKINTLLIQNKINTDALSLFTFIKDSIESREDAKFVFTKTLSQILKLIEEVGKKYNVTKESLAFVEIETIRGLYAKLDSHDLQTVFETHSNQNKELFRYTKIVKLPPLITKPDDIYSFHLPDDEANFITQKTISAEIICETELQKISPKGKIVFIKSADPGYDYLFSKKIAGLVTQYGGANSHMAVRCAELGVPAIIGAGEKNFSLWMKSKIIKIDCLNHQVQVIR